MAKRKWNSIEERAQAYEKVLETEKTEGITLDEAYERHGFDDPADRLDKNQLTIFFVQKNMSSECLPG